uniref:AAA_12 domain-containing protein n=1 Tax=Parastrongyloides trichosuri TaxID=131310 RepID=A0A0N4ZBJ3_PARTI
MACSGTNVICGYSGRSNNVTKVFNGFDNMKDLCKNIHYIGNNINWPDGELVMKLRTISFNLKLDKHRKVLLQTHQAFVDNPMKLQILKEHFTEGTTIKLVFDKPDESLKKNIDEEAHVYGCVKRININENQGVSDILIEICAHPNYSATLKQLQKYKNEYKEYSLSPMTRLENLLLPKCKSFGTFDNIPRENIENFQKLLLNPDIIQCDENIFTNKEKDSIIKEIVHHNKEVICIDSPAATGKTSTIARTICKYGNFKYLVVMRNDKCCKEFYETLFANNTSNKLQTKDIVIVYESKFKLEPYDNILYRKENFLYFSKEINFVYRSMNLYSNMFEPDYIIFDDSNQVTIKQVLRTFEKYPFSKYIFFGDSKSLSPYTVSNDISLTCDEFCDGSIIDLLNRHKWVKKIFLNQSFRMCPQIIDIVSRLFYNNKLECGLIKEEISVMENKLIQSEIVYPIIWYNTKQTSHNGSINNESFYNEEEANHVADLVKKKLLRHFNYSQIGVLCMFPSQAKIISRLIDNRLIDVETINDFHGREKDIIIICTTKAYVSNQGEDYITNRCRLVSAFTRARLAIFIYGNSEALEKSKIWKKIISKISFRYEI